MSDRSNKNKIIQDWFYAATSDLKCAKVLYDSRLFSAALYHLQQSNEKLAKGLLIAMGFLSHKRARKDLRIKEMLVFCRKSLPRTGIEPCLHSFQMLKKLFHQSKAF